MIGEMLETALGWALVLVCTTIGLLLFRVVLAAFSLWDLPS